MDCILKNLASVFQSSGTHLYDKTKKITKDCSSCKILTDDYSSTSRQSFRLNYTLEKGFLYSFHRRTAKVPWQSSFNGTLLKRLSKLSVPLIKCNSGRNGVVPQGLIASLRKDDVIWKMSLRVSTIIPWLLRFVWFSKCEPTTYWNYIGMSGSSERK